MNKRPFTKQEVAGVPIYQWIAWLISVALIALFAYLGVELPPLPPTPADVDPAIVSDATNLSDLTLSGALTAGTGVTASTGGLTATAGGLTVTAGGATVTAGGLTVSSGTSSFAGVISAGDGIENINLPSVITTTVSYTPASGTVATIADGEIWLVHGVFFQTTTNFDCTGSDCTLTVGDGNDADGFLALADASIQAAFTEATGFAAGFAGIESGSAGAYTTDDGGPFVYAPSGAAETIDYAVGGTDPAAGAGVAYVVYTRIQ